LLIFIFFLTYNTCLDPLQLVCIKNEIHCGRSKLAFLDFESTKFNKLIIFYLHRAGREIPGYDLCGNKEMVETSFL